MVKTPRRSFLIYQRNDWRNECFLMKKTKSTNAPAGHLVGRLQKLLLVYTHDLLDYTLAFLNHNLSMTTIWMIISYFVN